MRRIKKFIRWVFAEYFEAEKLYKREPKKCHHHKMITYVIYFNVKYKEGDTEDRCELFAWDSRISKVLAFQNSYNSLRDEYKGHLIRVTDVKILQ